MYPPIKDKFLTPLPSPRLYATVRRVKPRYLKAYLWLLFLALVFGTMLIYDHDVKIGPYLPTFSSFSVSQEQDWTIQPQTQDHQTFIETQHVTEIAATASNIEESLTSEDTSFQEYGTGANTFTPDDVLIMFKTGATSLWRRVPLHLSTTLADDKLTPNIVLYSDQADHIVSHPVIDVLANVSDALKSSPDFELYRSLQKVKVDNHYLETASMDGDHYLPGGWRLDKYKFLPMMAHAAKYHPNKKWYIYMEDDNYYFWKSLYNWLGRSYNPAEPFFLGSPAARLGEDFAHGGSGIIVSGAAMQQTFGNHPDLVDQYEPFARERCCGDLTLSHVMKDLGVSRDRRHDHSGWVGLQAMPTWRMGFGEWNWCSPIFNVHKVHQSDISRLHVLERQFRARFGENATMTWGQLFESTVLPLLTTETRTEWDNEANEKWYASKIEEDESLSDEEKRSKPWYSSQSCHKACLDWDRCLRWKYQDDACGLASTIALGKRLDEGVRMDSGFMMERVKQLMRKQCPEPL